MLLTALSQCSITSPTGRVPERLSAARLLPPNPLPLGFGTLVRILPELSCCITCTERKFTHTHSPQRLFETWTR